MEKTLELVEGAASKRPVGLRAVAALRVLMERPEMRQVENARPLGLSWTYTHGSKPRSPVAGRSSS
jgi:hypothetical protein